MNTLATGSETSARKAHGQSALRPQLLAGALLLTVMSLAGAGYLWWTSEAAASLAASPAIREVSAGVVMLCLLASIMLLLVRRLDTLAERDKRTTDLHIVESRVWLHTIIQNLPIGICVMSEPNKVLLVNTRYREMFGNTNDPDSDKPMHIELQATHPSGLAYDPGTWPCHRVLQGADPVYDEDILVERTGGERIWLSVSAAPIKAHSGKVISTVTAFIDITARKQTEEAHANALKGAINAEERERLRIARDLHDELGQDLVALSIGLKGLGDGSASRGMENCLQKLRKSVEEMSEHVHMLTRRLRPLALADFGLQRALEELVHGWATRMCIPSDIQCDCLPSWLSEAEQLTIYRVVQEALTNVAKHAGATLISVTAQIIDGRLRILIEDDGQGFMPETEPRRFGLVGLSERLAMIGGTLEVESRPGAGTLVMAIIPLRGRVENG